MLTIKALNRYQAFGLHIAISASLALALSALVFLLWYPGLLAYASNVTPIFLLLLLVDVVIGPVITLVIYNPQKKELKRDLWVIGVIQILALLYGLHTVFVTRPVYIVFNAAQFDLTYANQISEENMRLANNPGYQALPYLGPKLVAVALPEDPQLLTEIILASLQGKDDIPTQVQYFVPYVAQKKAILSSVKPLRELAPFNKDHVTQLQALVEKYQSAHMDVGYIPLKAKSHHLSVIINRSNGDVLEMSDLKPWP